MSGGQVAIGDKSTNQVRILQVTTNTVVQAYGVSAAPVDLALDGANNLLYATLAASTNLARIDLQTDTVTYVALPYPAYSVTVGNAGRVFASLLDNDIALADPVAIIDGPAGTVLAVQALDCPLLLAYDRPGEQLIAGDPGSSPSSLVRYSYDPATNLLTFVEERWDAGSNGQDIDVSPDGNRIAFACGAGNGSPLYTIFDFDSSNLTLSSGSWSTGAYPRSARFSADGSRIVASNGNDLQVFDVASHALLQSEPLDFTGCSYAMVQKVGYSPEGGTVYAYTDCGFDEDSGRLYFRTAP
jgi:DNA-binding beta-propeller fold protein YncE